METPQQRSHPGGFNLDAGLKQPSSQTPFDSTQASRRSAAMPGLDLDAILAKAKAANIESSTNSTISTLTDESTSRGDATAEKSMQSIVEAFKRQMAEKKAKAAKEGTQISTQNSSVPSVPSSALVPYKKPAAPTDSSPTTIPDAASIPPSGTNAVSQPRRLPRTAFDPKRFTSPAQAGTPGDTSDTPVLQPSPSSEIISDASSQGTDPKSSTTGGQETNGSKRKRSLNSLKDVAMRAKNSVSGRPKRDSLEWYRQQVVEQNVLLHKREQTIADLESQLSVADDRIRAGDLRINQLQSQVSTLESEVSGFKTQLTDCQNRMEEMMKHFAAMSSAPNATATAQTEEDVEEVPMSEMTARRHGSQTPEVSSLNGESGGLVPSTRNSMMPIPMRALQPFRMPHAPMPMPMMPSIGALSSGFGNLAPSTSFVTKFPQYPRLPTLDNSFMPAMPSMMHHHPLASMLTSFSPLSMMSTNPLDATPSGANSFVFPAPAPVGFRDDSVFGTSTSELFTRLDKAMQEARQPGDNVIRATVTGHDSTATGFEAEDDGWSVKAYSTRTPTSVFHSTNGTYNSGGSPFAF